MSIKWSSATRIRVDFHGFSDVPEQSPGFTNLDSLVQAFTRCADEFCRFLVDLTHGIRPVEIAVETYASS
jgi:hypothetical protein